jgi:REP element-mobilizing transposase RayT
MPHYYPKHLADFPYLGRLSYALEFTTVSRIPHLADRSAIDLVARQLARAAAERRFTLVVRCLMPDHAHLVIDGDQDDSDCRAFIKAAKQYSGYYFKHAYGKPLWQRYGYERFIRDDIEKALTIRYVLANPVRAGLVSDPRAYHGLGSQRYTIAELMQLSEYSETYLLD